MTAPIQRIPDPEIVAEIERRLPAAADADKMVQKLREKSADLEAQTALLWQTYNSKIATVRSRIAQVAREIKQREIFLKAKIADDIRRGKRGSPDITTHEANHPPEE